MQPDENNELDAELSAFEAYYRRAKRYHAGARFIVDSKLGGNDTVICTGHVLNDGRAVIARYVQDGLNLREEVEAIDLSDYEPLDV